MKEINELMNKLRGEFSERMEDSDIVQILEVLQEANHKVFIYKRALEDIRDYEAYSWNNDRDFISTRLKSLED